MKELREVVLLLIQHDFKSILTVKFSHKSSLHLTHVLKGKAAWSKLTACQMQEVMVLSALLALTLPVHVSVAPSVSAHSSVWDHQQTR